MDGNTIFEKYILKEQKEKERKKNGNIPKFLCRTMVNLFHKFKHIFENDPKLEKEIKKLVKEEKKKYDTNKNANNTL